MRRAIIAVLATLLVLLAIPVAPVLAASSAKVVVVVGPVGGHTAHYKSDANQVVREARRYTSNIVKLYTPNATWAKVRAAAQGASIFVYLGHGNGWPSIYAPFQLLTKDGLGLDPVAGANGTRSIYYGEDYIRNNVRFAPNAVVLLFHLCYASGNTEPGLSQGTFTAARQRVDNYGAGFIGAGARAVFAEGHPAHPVVSYIRQLFTTHRTMDQVFRAAPTWHGHLQGPYAAQRTPGLRFELDSDTTKPSGFYRSLVGDLALRASDVIRPPLRYTNIDPDDFVVPGAAQVTAAAGTGLFPTPEAAADPAGLPASTLASGTRLRLTAEAAPAADGTRVFATAVLGRSAGGFVRATGLAPRDSDAVLAWTLDHSAALLSPNADGSNDGLVVAVRFSEPVAATITVKDAAGATVRTASSTGDIARFAWDLETSSGAATADGTYSWSLKVAADAWGNTGLTRSGSFTTDATAPVTSASMKGTTGGGGWLVSPAVVTLAAKDALSGVRSISWRVDGGTARTYTGPASVATNGTHAFEYRAVDKAGIREAWKKLTLRIDTTAPTIRLPLSGPAGDVAGLWHGPVTVTPAIGDAASGVATRTVSVDGAPPTPLGTSPVVVAGDGRHTVAATATDVAGNARSASTSFTIDTVVPVVELPAPAATPPTVSPNGDGAGERLAIPFAVSEPSTISAVVANATGAVVRTLTSRASAGSGTIAWDGRTAAGAPLPDGRYAVTLAARDLAGNPGAAVTTDVDVYSALKGLARTPTRFFPQDADTLAKRTTAAFTLLAPATVSVRVIDATGALVRSAMTDRALPAGAATWAWDGRSDAGAFVPRGTYRIVVAATNGTQVATQVTSVLADAFRLTTSTSTATRGRALTITAVTTEALSTVPRVVVRQPGFAARSVRMTRVSGSTWRATITPRKGGAAGSLSLTVKATDSHGGTNTSVARLALR